jgi:hypothetical protein
MRWEPQNGIVFVAMATIALLWLGYGLFTMPVTTAGIVLIVCVLGVMLRYLPGFARGLSA